MSLFYLMIVSLHTTLYNELYYAETVSKIPTEKKKTVKGRTKLRFTFLPDKTYYLKRQFTFIIHYENQILMLPSKRLGIQPAFSSLMCMKFFFEQIPK